MHHTSLMGPIQRIGDLDGIPQGLVQWQRHFPESLGQRLALQVLHDEEVHALVLADVVESADMQMVQTRDGARLALEALAAVRVSGHA